MLPPELPPSAAYDAGNARGFAVVHYTTFPFDADRATILKMAYAAEMNGRSMPGAAYPRLRSAAAHDAYFRGVKDGIARGMKRKEELDRELAKMLSGDRPSRVKSKRATTVKKPAKKKPASARKAPAKRRAKR